MMKITMMMKMIPPMPKSSGAFDFGSARYSPEAACINASRPDLIPPK
jgi:hypothetical protein